MQTLIPRLSLADCCVCVCVCVCLCVCVCVLIINCWPQCVFNYDLNAPIEFTAAGACVAVLFIDINGWSVINKPSAQHKRTKYEYSLHYSQLAIIEMVLVVNLKIGKKLLLPTRLEHSVEMLAR